MKPRASLFGGGESKSRARPGRALRQGLLSSPCPEARITSELRHGPLRAPTMFFAGERRASRRYTAGPNKNFWIFSKNGRYAKRRQKRELRESGHSFPSAVSALAIRAPHGAGVKTRLSTQPLYMSSFEALRRARQKRSRCSFWERPAIALPFLRASSKRQGFGLVRAGAFYSRR